MDQVRWWEERPGRGRLVSWVWDQWSQVRKESVVTDAGSRSIVVSGKRMLLEAWREGPGEQTTALGDWECWE